MKSLSDRWFNKYKNIGTGNPLNRAQNIIIDKEDTNIPLNLPSFFVGSKNAGKSTLINTIINASTKNNIYKNIIYIYTDNVDSTLAENCHTLLTRVPLRSSVEYLTEYLNAKTQFHSWVNFLDINNITIDNINAVINDELYKTNPELMIKNMLEQYIDNVVDEYVRTYILNSKKQIETGTFGPLTNQLRDRTKTAHAQEYTNPVLQLINHAIEYILKYSKPFTITVDNVVYNIDGFRVDDYDLIIIDDVALAADLLFPIRQQKSPIYPFLTVSRHILCGWIIAGQDLMQLPKYARKEMNTYAIGYGIDIVDLNNTHIPKNKINEIIKDYPNLKQHDFILYNGINNVVIDLLMSRESTRDEAIQHESQATNEAAKTPTNNDEMNTQNTTTKIKRINE